MTRPEDPRKRAARAAHEPGGQAPGREAPRRSGPEDTRSIASRERRFFLADGLDDPRLDPADRQHALRVLRVRAGEELIGLDGRGGSVRLLVRTAGRAELTLAVVPGSQRRDPAPGAAGAWPRLEVACALPKGSRFEETWPRLVALGAAAWRPLVCARSAPGARALPAARKERLARLAAEACKQSGRTWLPEILPVQTPHDWLAERTSDDATAFADHEGTRDAAGWTRDALGSARQRTLRIAIGPEGGFDLDELRAFEAAGATPIALGPHVLRIEVAAEAAVAIFACVAHALAPPRA